MRKNVFGRQLKRDRNERKALFKSLMSSLIMHGRIQTTEEKAKAIKGQIEKLVTKARKGQGIANTMQEYLSPQSISKLIVEVAPQFKSRSGGYTRIVKLGRRFSDNASMVFLEWVEEITPVIADKKIQKQEKQAGKPRAKTSLKVVEKKLSKPVTKRKTRSIVKKEVKK